MLFKKKRYEIHYQIEEFAYARREHSTTNRHKDWLYQFVKVTGAQRAEDITLHDIKGFIDAIQDIHTPFTKLQAMAAIRIFMEYCRQNGILDNPMETIEKKKMGRPEKLERNSYMAKLYAQDQKRKNKKWPVRILAKEFGMKESTAFTILKRYGVVKKGDREVIHS